MTTRIQNPTTLAELDIGPTIEAGEATVIQFSEPVYTDEILDAIDSLCKLHKNNLNIRFYGHNQKPFDTNTLTKLPNVRSLSLDSLTQIANHEKIDQLQYLSSLGIGVFDLNDKELLNKLPIENLKHFSLGPTRWNNIELSALSQCKDLQSLSIIGHSKNIETLANLQNLSEVHLGSMNKKVGLAFLNNIATLNKLSILFGSRNSIEDLDNPHLTHLEIMRIRNLHALGPISRFSNLCKLEIEDQPKLIEIDFKGASKRLSEIRISGCKGIQSLPNLVTVASLDNLFLYAGGLNMQNIIDNNLPRSVKNASLVTGKIKMDNELRLQLDQLGIDEFNWV